MRIPFGTASGITPDKKEASLFILKNGHGMEAAVTDFGATLVRLIVPDKDGTLRDVVLGYDDAGTYEREKASVGATVGRFANRIGQGTFTINGKEYKLTVNNGPNALHGGRDFYVHRFWETIKESDSSVTFALHSPDGDQGFPGNLDITVTYHLTDENELRICYTARSDQDTPLNLTNHSYFNLKGHDGGSVLSQILTFNSDLFTETDENSLPTGKYLPVEGTPMDFRKPKALGQDIEKDYKPLIIGNGYDHNYVLKNEGQYREVARITCEETGITMTVSTDLPGMQLYTANYLKCDSGKGGAVYRPRDAVCFESQYYPDAVNKEHFPGGVLKAGELFESVTGYRF